MSPARASLLPRPRSHPLYSFPRSPPRFCMCIYERLYPCVYDGPLWALLTLHCYLVASTRAHVVSQLFSNNRRVLVLIPLGLWRSPVVSSVYIGFIQGAQRGKLLLLFRGITLVARRAYSHRKVDDRERKGRSLSLALLLLLDCFRRCRYFAKYTQRA